jgi:hypothetical protein
MTYPRTAASLLLALALATTWRSAGAEPPKGRVHTVAAPAGTDARVRRALGESIEHELATAGLAPSLGDFTVAASLVQLRRYVKAQGAAVEWVCVVDLALLDQEGNVVVSVRGNAATPRGEARETLNAAAHAAVARLPEALQALDAARKRAEKVARG